MTQEKGYLVLVSVLTDMESSGVEAIHASARQRNSGALGRLRCSLEGKV